MLAKYLKITISVTTILILFILSGCFNSNTNNSTPYYTISDEFANYCWFETGSYWVFQNDNTLVTDTIKISDVVETKRFHNENGGFNYQAVEMYTTSNGFDISRYEITAGNFEAKQGAMNSLLRLYKYDGTYQIVFLPQYSLGEEIILGDEIGVYTNVEIMTSFELNNKTYQDVYHTKVVISSTNSEYHYWIAKYHGLIKVTSTIDGQTSSISVKSDLLVGYTK